MTSLNLEEGDIDRAERIADTQSAGQIRRQRKKVEDEKAGKKPPPRASAQTRDDNQLVTQLNNAFDSLVAGLEARGDEELATAIREEKESMSRAFVAVTRTVPVFRRPLVFLLSFLVGIVAFWRVGGILIGRVVERRQQRAYERAAANGAVEREVVG